MPRNGAARPSTTRYAPGAGGVDDEVVIAGWPLKLGDHHGHASGGVTDHRHERRAVGTNRSAVGASREVLRRASRSTANRLARLDTTWAHMCVSGKDAIESQNLHDVAPANKG